MLRRLISGKPSVCSVTLCLGDPKTCVSEAVSDLTFAGFTRSPFCATILKEKYEVMLM